MGAQDLALRGRAIPYYANVWGYNRNQDSDNDISVANNLGDITNLAPTLYAAGGTIAATNPIRYCQPAYGEIITASLHLNLTTATAEASGLELRLAIGYFGQYWEAETSYSEEYIAASHKLITGTSEPFSIAGGGNTFNAPTINLTPALYRRGDALFNPDGFVLVLAFNRAPDTGAGYFFIKCDVECTMQMGLA